MVACFGSIHSFQNRFARTRARAPGCRWTRCVDTVRDTVCVCVCVCVCVVVVVVVVVTQDAKTKCESDLQELGHATQKPHCANPI